MKLLSYHYHLKIDMDMPVSDHRFTLRCTPVSDERQRILRVEHYISPADFLSESQDGWGNSLIYGSCREKHTCFEANVCGQAMVGLAEAVLSENPVRDQLFQYATPLTTADAALCQFAEELQLKREDLTGDNLPQNNLAQAERVMKAVHSALKYVPGTTTVSTTAAQAFAMGCGVCQDYAHVMLAVLRRNHIPCRYVVGMLLGEGKSHAWVEVLHEGQWFAFDPTNDRRVRDEHIKLSHGRDYLDCAINRGLFRGNACQTTEISVVVSEIKEK